MAVKEYTVEFLVANTDSDDPNVTPSAAFDELQRNTPAMRFMDYEYEVRDFAALGGGRSYRGIFAKYRHNDIPHIAAPAAREREIELAEDEGIIEKNHFLFYSRHNLLVYQSNGHGSRASMLSRYLTHVMNDTVKFSPVLQPDALQRLMDGNAEPKKLEVSFARPDDHWIHANRTRLTGRLAELMGQVGGHRIHLTITAPREHYLNLNAKQLVQRLVEDDDLEVNVARMKVEQNGIQEPIDLIADRLADSVTVNMRGRYPVTDEMFQALNHAYDQNRRVLNQIFNAQRDAED